MNSDTSDKPGTTFDYYMTELTHQIRSPLNNIINIAELGLRERPADPVRGFFEDISRYASGLLLLLDDIIEDVTGSRCRDREGPDAFSITSVLEEVRQGLESLWQPEHTEIVLDLDSEMPECFQAHGAKLRKVLVRLMDFAVRNASSGRIHAGLGRNEDGVLEFHLKLPVSSSLSLETLEKEPGLAVCRGLLAAMSSRLHVSLEGGMLGFEFAVDALPVPLSGRICAKGGFGEICFPVIIVDSDPFSSVIACRRLSLEGIPVEIVDSLEKAIEFLKSPWERSEGKVVCIVDWDEVKGREDFGLGLLQRATRRGKLVVLLSDVPAVDMMRLGLSVSKKEEGAVPAGFIMRPTTGKGMLVEMARVLGRNPGDIFLPDSQAAKGRKKGTLMDILKGRKVLIVEDDRINQQILVDILKNAGTRPVVASTGAAAERAMGKKRFDAVFMDIRLPDCDGIELTAKMRRRQVNAHTPVIALSAGTTHEQRCLDAGMKCFLTKPYSREAILNTLARVLE